MSKTFTALLLADAVVRDEVPLDEPVADLLPGGTVVPTFNSKPITLEALATHRSGLPRLPTNLKPANPADPYADYTASQLDSFLSTYKLPRAPGDSAEYSNLGFGFLGYALTTKEHATSWGALVQQRIADPLGMRETFVDVPAGTWLVGGTVANPIWWHDGETGGFASFAAFDPARNAAIVVADHPWRCRDHYDCSRRATAESDATYDTYKEMG